MDEIRKDKRFAKVLGDRRFGKVPLKERKTKIDKRFQSMFKDKGFKLEYTMDKRGRPMSHTSSEDLKKYYNVSSESEDDEDEINEEAPSQEKKISSSDSEDEDTEAPKSKKSIETSKQQKDESEVESEEGEDSSAKKSIETSKEQKDESEIDSEEGEDSDADASDTEDTSETSSDDESDSSADEAENHEFDHKWEEFNRVAPVTDEISKRLALCNMDWDRIRSEDILTVFNSFKPSESIINSIKIYPSEYGRQRMEEENLKGPIELVEETLADEEDPDKKISLYNREKLRQYQLNRLKYYYAVVDCDTPETANSLYEQLNGMEYESSAVTMDIRFIPDDVTFDEEPTSSALTVPDPTEYKPRLFINTALQQTKVDLTWDENDPGRQEILKRAFQEPESIEKDLRTYLASSSESGSDDESNITEPGLEKRSMAELIASYKALVQPIEDKEDEEKYDLEITWEPGLKEKTDEILEEKMQPNLTPFEKKLKDDKEKKKQKKRDKKQIGKTDEATDSEDSDDITSRRNKGDKFKTRNEDKDSKMAGELSLLMGSTSQQDDGDTKIVKSRKKKLQEKKKLKELKNDDFEVDVEDPRFSAIYSSHLYNIDPSDPHFKSTKGMQSIIEGKQKNWKRPIPDSIEQSPSKRSKMSEEAMRLVDSVKRKTALRQKNK